jgi:pilus assembly protein CpaC
MHPTKATRLWTAAAVLTMGIAVLAGSAGAQEKDKEKKKDESAVADKSGAVTVTIGGQQRFQMKSKKRIRDVFNENDRVVEVRPDATDPTAIILLGRSAGTSRLELTDADGGKETYLVVVQRDLELLKNLIRKTVPTAAVEVTPIGESGTSIILGGYTAREEDKAVVQQLAEALGLRVAVNTMSVGGGGNVPHVQLDLTLAKVDRSRARSRGANWVINGSTVSVGSILGGLSTVQGGQGVVAATQTVGVIPSAAQIIPTGSANIIAGYAPGKINLLLAALKTEGLAKLVTAPTVVTRSGETAELLVGGRVPVISPAAGINGPGVRYEDIGTTLNFTPVVYGNGKIYLDIRPKVTSVNNAQALVTTFGTSPAFDEQRMNTSVIVEPGQTVAIGGLIQTNQASSVTKIPCLGDIPYVGWLFSFATTTEQETELVILVTPRLVDPADCSQMPKALPGSETRKPDDFEFYLETILEAPRGQRQIWAGYEYTPAWQAGPSAAIYPCLGGTGPYGGGAGGNCPGGNCPAGVAATRTNGPDGKVIVTPPSSLPPVSADPMPRLMPAGGKMKGGMDR